MKLPNARGAVVIHVAFALFALLCFTAFVVDQGVMLASRRQAQNAADAGALAGAISLMLNSADHDGATSAAQHFAGTQHYIWGQQTATANIRVWPLPFLCPESAGGGNACIRVDVFRGTPDPNANTAHTNFLPTYFAQLFGIDVQGVRATATAQVAAGNAVSCIKPWIVVDKWADNSTGADAGVGPGWDQLDRFTPGVDSYIPCTQNSVTCTGFRADGPNNDIGLQLMLKGDDGLDPGGEWSAGWSMRIELGGGNGAATYMDEIQGCPEWVPDIGFYDGSVPCETRADQDFEEGCINVRPGVSQGPTVKHGVDRLVKLDSGASWNTTTNSIQGGCTQTGTCAQVHPDGNDYSPRIIPLALFNPARCVTTGCSSGNNTVAEVVQIMGFFLEGTCDDVYATDPNGPPAWCGPHPNQTVVGRIMNYPGQASSASGSAGPWSFLKVIRLVR